MPEDDIKKSFEDRFDSYSHGEKEKKWTEENAPLIHKLFENIRIRDFIFEPFKGVFTHFEDDPDEKILSTITQVAIANAVIAGLPGKLGVGVAVSICLEAWMAYTIARSVGIKIKSINDVWAYMGLLGGVAVVILFVFRHLLGFAFAMFNMVGALPATILAELLVTDIVGVLFWFGFAEANKTGRFRIPKMMIGHLLEKTTELFSHQEDFATALCNKDNIKLVGSRLKSWFSGDIISVEPGMRGEIFAFAAMAYLIEGKYDELKGPLGEQFIESIRRAYSSQLGDATLEQMSNYFSGHTPAQLSGDINLVKGEMFEHLVEHLENIDGDHWTAQLHDIRTVPGSDIIFTNIETGQQIEVSLKSTDMPGVIEEALKRYPDIPILTTTEVEQYFGDHPLVDYTEISDAKLEKITEDNFERLVDDLEPISAAKIATSGVISKTITSVYPFVIAYIRRKITQEQLKIALTKVLGDSGVSLASRLSFAIILGPVFAWYLLARSVLLMVKSAQRLN